MTLLPAVLVVESVLLLGLIALWHWRMRKITVALALLEDLTGETGLMRCGTCRHQRTDPVVFHRHPPMTDSTCGRASRGPTDDTPHDDDGEPIVVRCATLGGGCRAWEPRAVR